MAKNENMNDEMIENTGIEMTEDAKKALTRKYEDDILGGLLAAAAFKTNEEDTVLIEIKRRDVVLFKFHIRPLSEEEYLDCKKRNTNYKKNRQLGTRVAESVNAARYRAELIYLATVEKDREAVWDNRNAWHQLNVLNGIDLVEVVLMAGEKDAILSKLDEISGYQPTLEDVAKN